VLPALAAADLRTSDVLAIEKPFGTDLASAQHLNQILRIQLPQPVIFRIDHFLSDELVRRVLALRFVNRVFEPIWDAVHVDHVNISWLESLTLEGRASYYDRAGAMKDMVQNHLMDQQGREHHPGDDVPGQPLAPVGGDPCSPGTQRNKDTTPAVVGHRNCNLPPRHARRITSRRVKATCRRRTKWPSEAAARRAPHWRVSA
jgi:hypothetical protein